MAGINWLDSCMLKGLLTPPPILDTHCTQKQLKIPTTVGQLHKFSISLVVRSILAIFVNIFAY